MDMFAMCCVQNIYYNISSQVLFSTTNLCFEAKIGKKYDPIHPSFTMGCEGVYIELPSSSC